MRPTPTPHVSRALWVDRCTMALGRCLPGYDPRALAQVAAEHLWHEELDIEPEVAAQIYAVDLEAHLLLAGRLPRGGVFVGGGC